MASSFGCKRSHAKEAYLKKNNKLCDVIVTKQVHEQDILL